VGGIIKAGLAVNAVSNSVVPKITVIIGARLEPDTMHVRQSLMIALRLCWPTARYAVMSGDSGGRYAGRIYQKLEREKN